MQTRILLFFTAHCSLPVLLPHSAEWWVREGRCVRFQSAIGLRRARKSRLARLRRMCVYRDTSPRDLTNRRFRRARTRHPLGATAHTTHVFVELACAILGCPKSRPGEKISRHEIAPKMLLQRHVSKTRILHFCCPGSQ